jgi:hypothetical protein
VSVFITEHEFELPKGFIDAEGNLHRRGTMRLATAADEILPMKDPRVQALPAYLIVILMSRVVTKLGTLPQVNPGIVEGLFTEDLSFLQSMYNRINGLATETPVSCPKCAHQFAVEARPPGELSATP